jgi:acyl-CoA reductase-like NAD-dependent aldehyde dehydrogenase
MVMLVLKHKMFINGEWTDSESGETFSRVNPANPDEVLGEFQKGNALDAEKAVDAAEEAFEPWSETPAPTRAEHLYAIAKLLTDQKEELSILMTREMGKTLPDSRADVQEAIDLAYCVAGEGRRLLGHTTPSEKQDKVCMTLKLPIGVVGLITPWNFPVAIPARKIFFALVCGNTLVWKPATDTPMCSLRLVELFEKAKLPKGVLNCITGPGETVGTSIVKNNRVRMISFTGNKDTGATILKEAGIKRVSLELGGKNPIIIMDDADIDLAVNGVIWGGYETTGQRCTAASRVIIHEKIKDKVEQLLTEQIRRLKLGNGLDPSSDIGPLVNKAAQEKTSNYCKIGQQEGAKLVLGGKIPSNLKGWFFEPTLFTDATKDMRIAKEEIFGPVVTTFSAANLDQAINIANSVEYGLSSAIYTNSLKSAFTAIRKLESGLTYVNSPTIGSEAHLPFGGVKHSGTTREGGPDGTSEFTELKTIYIDYSGKLQKTFIG